MTTEATPARKILITGQVRSPELLARSLADFAALRAQKLLDQVIFSTWRGELQAYPELDRQFRRSGFELIESDPPLIPGTGHIWCQMLNLERGLDPAGPIHPHDRVIKTRPDLHMTPGLIAKLLNDESYLSPLTGGDAGEDCGVVSQVAGRPVFSHRIWIPWFEITKPFYMADECFAGRAADLLKLVNYDSRYDILRKMDAGITHIRRFIHPFLEQNGEFELFLRYFGRSGHFSAHRFTILGRNLELDPFIRMLVRYYRVIQSHFRVESDDSESKITFRAWSVPGPAPDPRQVGRNFTSAASWSPSGGHIYAYNTNWIDALLGGAFDHQKLPGDEFAARFDRWRGDSGPLVLNGAELEVLEQEKARRDELLDSTGPGAAGSAATDAGNGGRTMKIGRRWASALWERMTNGSWRKAG